MVSYLGPGAWQRGASAGMQYHVTPWVLLRADVVYSGSTAFAAVSSYRRISVNASYDVQLNLASPCLTATEAISRIQPERAIAAAWRRSRLKGVSNSGKISKSIMMMFQNQDPKLSGF
jgi:hypothetical protein